MMMMMLACFMTLYIIHEYIQDTDKTDTVDTSRNDEKMVINFL